MSPSSLRRALVVTALLGLTSAAYSQDWQAESRINALKGLPSVALVFRQNMPVEVYSLKDWSNLIEVGLRRNTPELRILATQDTPNWLELSVVTTDSGGAIELSVLRWVKVSATGQEVVAKVWNESRFVFGSVSKESLKDSLDSMILSLSADFSRAKRR
jgi:hypothetical protein